MMLGTESVCDLHTGRDTTLKTQADVRVRHMEDGRSRACTAEHYLWNMRGKQSMTILQSLLIGMTKSVDGY